MVQVLDKGYIELIDHMGSDNTVVSSARVSHLGESKGSLKDALLIKYLLENGHTSPFEHVVFQFKVKTPLFVARQWMRHRTWSYNEVSRRYTEDDIDFYIPDIIRAQSKDNPQMSEGELDNSSEQAEFIRKITSLCEDTYKILLTAGVAREQARIILPVNLYTSFYATVDLHNLFHFLKLRNHPHAQEEIRLYAQAIEQLIEPIVPVSYHTWKELHNHD